MMCTLERIRAMLAPTTACGTSRAGRSRRTVWLFLASCVIGGACQPADDVSVSSDAQDASGTSDDGATGHDPTATDTVSVDSGVGQDAPSPLSREEMLSAGPFAVSRFDLELVDDTRPTASNPSFEGAPTRSMPTAIWYPRGEGATRDVPIIDAAGAPYPVVVYGHGFLSRGTDNQRLMRHLTSHGWVAAGPTFPLTNREAPGDPSVGDVANQPADVHFVLDELERRAADDDDPLFGMLDTERVAMVGVSLGSMTALLTSLHPDFRDERLRAVVAAAAPTCFLPVEEMTGGGTAVLLMHGDDDSIVPIGESLGRAYDAALAPKMRVTLHGGNHTNWADAASMLTALPNSDTLGCDAIASRIPDGGLGDLSESLGGRPADEVDSACSPPCTGIESAPPTSPVSEQLDLFDAATLAFIESFVRHDDGARRFLIDGLAESFDIDVEYDFGVD